MLGLFHWTFSVNLNQALCQLCITYNSQAFITKTQAYIVLVVINNHLLTFLLKTVHK
jgi:hypothetical protein